MSKQEADTIFVEMLPFFERMATGTAIKLNKQLETHLVTNEAYLHMFKNLDSIQTEKDLQKLVVNFIVKNIGWTNSQINKQERLSIHDELIQDDENEESNKLEDKSDLDLEQKIEIERWYTEKLALLQMYRQQETDKVKQIIFDCYFNKGITKGIAMAKHLGINKNAGCQLVKQMKQDIKEYANKNKNNIK